MECDNTFHIKDHHPNLITQRADYTGNDGNMGCGAFRIEEYEDNKENAMIFVDFEKGMKLSIEDENMTIWRAAGEGANRLPWTLQERSWSASRGAGISDEGDIAQPIIPHKLGDRERHYGTQYTQRLRGAVFMTLVLAASIICGLCFVEQQFTCCERTLDKLGSGN